MTALSTHRQMGSKARVARELLRLLPASGVAVWVEGFAGTAAVTLAKAPHPVEHINDLNGDVVNLWRVMRDERSLQRLCRALALTPYAQEEFEVARDEVFATDADGAGDPVERARRWLVASWQAIGGKQHARASWRLDLGRSWLIGVWDGVPERLVTAAERLRRCHVHRRHILELVDQFAGRDDALLFLDPPYPRHTLATHEALYSVDMSPDEHEQLVRRLQGARCRVLLTMAQGTVYGEALTKGWHARALPVRGLRNTVKDEVVYTNYVPPAAPRPTQVCLELDVPP